MAKADLEKAGFKVMPPSKEKGVQVWFQGSLGSKAAPKSLPAVPVPPSSQD